MAMSSVHGKVLTKRVRCGGKSVVSPGEVLLPGLSSQQRPSRAPHAWCGWQCACSRLAPLQLSCTNSFSAPSTCRQHVQCMCSGYVHALHYRTRSTRHTAHKQRTQHARHLAHSAQHRHHSRTAPMCIQCMCMCMCTCSSVQPSARTGSTSTISCLRSSTTAALPRS